MELMLTVILIVMFVGAALAHRQFKKTGKWFWQK